MATISHKLPSQTSKNTAPKEESKPSSDEKKDEEELNMISSLDTLFEEYRIVKELAFDISKQEKTNKLNNIQKKIEILIKSIDERYPYKETLNMDKDKDNKENNNNNKNKNKKKNKTIIEKDKIIEKDNNMNVIISRAQYLYIIGRYYYILNNFLLSSPLLQESIKLDPLLIECWNTLGDIYYNNSELLASKFCFESALEYDKYNKISYISLSKILRKLHSKNQMEIMENCICSLILAKQALKYSKNNKKNKNSSLSLKDGELWFNLGNAYLMTFLNCINGYKLESSIKLQKEDDIKTSNTHNSDINIDKKQSKNKKTNSNSKDEENKIDIGIDETYFEKEYEYEQIYSEIRREIETELNDSQNNLLYHIYIKKCLSAYKCASTKCIINKHSHHPDLYCNRSHIYIYQENYEQSLQDLKLSIKYGRNDNGSKDEQSAKIIHDELLTKICKISKQISNKTSNKMIKKLTNFSEQISRYMKQCSDYYTRQLHYDLVTFDKLNNGLNGGNVIVIKILGLMQPSNQLPLHFIVCDNNNNMFVLSFYLRGHALNHIYKIVNQINIINTQTLICVANPVKRHIKFNHGSKHIDFYTISFQKPQDICIGGKFFFNQ